MRERHGLNISDMPSWSDSNVLRDVEKNGSTMVGIFFDKGNACLGYVIIEPFNKTNIISWSEINPIIKNNAIQKNLLKYILHNYKEIIVSPNGDHVRFYLENGFQPFATHTGGYFFVNPKGRNPSEVKHATVGDEFSIYQPDDNFVYIPSEWDDYVKYL